MKEMVQKNCRNWSMKYILPLLFDNFNIFSSIYNFVNVYIGDENNPQLDNHIFLMYESNISMKFFDEINNTIRSRPDFYTYYQLQIDGKFYNIFVLTLAIGEYKEEIKELIAENYHLVRYETKVKILHYWPYKVNSYEHMYLFDLESTLPSLKMKDEVIPEKDPPEGFQWQVDMELALYE